MKTKSGILYSLRNKAWDNYKKCGRTTQKLNKRLSNLQTSLVENCEIIYTTEELIDCYFYEYLLKKILKGYRVRVDREFFNIDEEEIKIIYDFFNELNKELNTVEKLNNYININIPDYYNKKSQKEKIFINNIKSQRRKICIDTSY